MTELEQAQERIAELVDTVRRLENEVALLNGQTNSERTCRLEADTWDTGGECTWGVRCTSCGTQHSLEKGYGWRYCPHCGAKVVEE